MDMIAQNENQVNNVTTVRVDGCTVYIVTGDEQVQLKGIGPGDMVVWDGKLSTVRGDGRLYREEAW